MEAVASGGLFSSSFLGSTASAIGLLLLALWSALLMFGIRVERPMVKMAGVVLTALGFSMLLGLYGDLGVQEGWRGGFLGHWVGERCENTGLAGLSRVLLWLAVPAAMLVATEWLFLGYVLRGERPLAGGGRLAAVLDQGVRFFARTREASPPRASSRLLSRRRGLGPSFAEERGCDILAPRPFPADPVVRPMQRTSQQPAAPQPWSAGALERSEPAASAGVEEFESPAMGAGVEDREPPELGGMHPAPEVEPPLHDLEEQTPLPLDLGPLASLAGAPDVAEVLAFEKDLDLDPIEAPLAADLAGAAWWKTDELDSGEPAAEPKPTVAVVVNGDAGAPPAAEPAAACVAAPFDGAPASEPPPVAVAAPVAEDAAPALQDAQLATLPSAVEPAAPVLAEAAPAAEPAAPVLAETAAHGDEPAPPPEDPVAALGAEEADLFRKALSVVVRENRASISLLQKDLGLGYFRAAKLLNTLEAHGVIAPYSGSSARKVVISEEEAERLLAPASR